MQSETYFTDLQLAERFAVSRVTPWRWSASGIFPQPIRLSPGCTRWRGSDVDAVIAARTTGKSDDEIRDLVKQLKKKCTETREGAA